MLRFGIRGHDVPVTGSFEEWAAEIRKQEFCCIQLALKKAVKDFPVNMENMSPGMAMYMRNVFQKNEIDVAVLGCYLNLTTPDEEEWSIIRKAYEQNIRFAALLGCGMVGTETGAVNKEYRYVPENRSEKALQCLIERLKPLTEYAESMGVLLGIEPVCRHIMWNVEATRKVLDAVHSPNLRVIFDPVNLLDTSNYLQQDQIINEAFQTLLYEIDVLHIKDFQLAEGELSTRNVTLGEGLLNVPLIAAHAKKEKPCIHILLEDSTPANAQKSKKYMEETYSRVN